MTTAAVILAVVTFAVSFILALAVLDHVLPYEDD